MKKIVLALVILFLFVSYAHATFKTFWVRHGATSITDRTGAGKGNEVDHLGKFDSVFMQKRHYDDQTSGGDNCYQMIKDSNANTGPSIYIYEVAHQVDFDETVANGWDDYETPSLGRWTDDRCGMTENVEDDGHALGGGDPWICTYDGDYIYHGLSSGGRIQLDFSNSDVRAYIAEAYLHDIESSAPCSRGWGTSSDGLYSDHFYAIPRAYYDSTDTALYTQTPDYPAEFTDGINYNNGTDSFQYTYVQLVNDIVVSLASKSYGFGIHFGWFERDDTADVADVINVMTNKPAFMWDEVGLGTPQISGNCTSGHDDRWTAAKVDYALENYTSFTNIPVMMQVKTSHSSYTDDFTDTGGYSWNGYDALWYTLMFFHLFKKSTDYVSWVPYCQTYFNDAGVTGYVEPGPWNGVDDDNYYPAEYTYLQQIGEPLGAYYTKTAGGVKFYIRKFTNGYAIVNPSASANSGAVSIANDLDITETVKEITKDNMSSSWESASTITEFSDGSFVGYRGKFLYYTPSVSAKSAGVVSRGRVSQ